MSTYLVTGAAGFIASKVCEMLLAAGHTVVGGDNLNDYYDVRLKNYRLSALLGATVDRGRFAPQSASPTVHRPPSNGERLVGASGRFIFHALDIENLPELERLFAAHSFSAVFNLAGRAGVRFSMEHPHVYLSTNTLGTLNVLECQRKYGVKKHVLASSSSLYAGCPMPFSEDQPVNTPQSPYAATKKAAELMAYTYHKLYGLDVTVLRYFTVFGPAGRPDMAPLRFIKWIDEGTPIKLYGDGTQARDFTYVDDIARGTILAAAEPRGCGLGVKGYGLGEGAAPNPVDNGRSAPQSDRPPATGQEPSTGEAKLGVKGYELRGESHAPGAPTSDLPAPSSQLPASGYEIINLGGGRQPTTLNEVIAIIEEALGKKAVINHLPANQADVKETWADISKAKRLLGWEPTVSAAEGFKAAVAWHVANRNWLADVSTESGS